MEENTRLKELLKNNICNQCGGKLNEHGPSGTGSTRKRKASTRVEDESALMMNESGSLDKPMPAPANNLTLDSPIDPTLHQMKKIDPAESKGSIQRIASQPSPFLVANPKRKLITIGRRSNGSPASSCCSGETTCTFPSPAQRRSQQMSHLAVPWAPHVHPRSYFQRQRLLHLIDQLSHNLQP